MRLTLSGPGGGALPANYALRLYDAQQTQIAASNKAGAAPEVIEISLAAGLYYASPWRQLRLRARRPTMGSARARPTPTRPGPSLPPPEHASDKDLHAGRAPPPPRHADRRHAAAAPTPTSRTILRRRAPGRPATTTLHLRSLDQDWFAIKLQRGQEFVARLDEQPGDYYMELYDPRGVPVAEGYPSPDAFHEEMKYRADEVAGEYRVVVRTKDGSAYPDKTYLLRLQPGGVPPATATFTPTATPVCPEDIWELNDTAGAARPIPAGEAIHAFICPRWDWDFYQVDVPAARCRGALYDLAAAVRRGALRADGAMASAGRADTSDRLISYRAPAAGAYLVRVTRAALPPWRRTACGRPDDLPPSPSSRRRHLWEQGARRPTRRERFVIVGQG